MPCLVREGAGKKGGRSGPAPGFKQGGLNRREKKVQNVRESITPDEPTGAEASARSLLFQKHTLSRAGKAWWNHGRGKLSIGSQ